MARLFGMALRTEALQVFEGMITDAIGAGPPCVVDLLALPVKILPEALTAVVGAGDDSVPAVHPVGRIPSSWGRRREIVKAAPADHAAVAEAVQPCPKRLGQKPEEQPRQREGDARGRKGDARDQEDGQHRENSGVRQATPGGVVRRA